MPGREAAASRRPWFAWLGVLGVVLLGLQAARSAVVAALSERRPEFAHAVWPAHPSPQVTLALAAIGSAARQGKPPNPKALAMMDAVGLHDPLAFDPLLVAGTARLAEGDSVRGEQLVKAALHREPRSTAAHFLLAELHVREGRVGKALIHVAVLGRRLRGGGAEPFAAALATYLRDPTKVAEVRGVLDQNASLRSSVLTKMAQDVEAIRSLRLLTRRDDAGEEWFRLAFERQLGTGNVGEARGLLAAARVSGGATALSDWSAPGIAGPLAWRLPASSDGVAEVGKDGSLGLVYYGRADAGLADHLLLLPPGAYRFAAQFAGTPPAGSFEWRVTCIQGGRMLTTWPVAASASAQLLQVPADCASQRLALWGRMGDFPRTVSATLTRVALSPAVSRQ